MSAVALGLRFVVAELGALAAVLWWGFTAGGAGGVLAGIGLAVAIVLVWWAFVAPKAARRAADPQRLVLELLIFAAATAALVRVGHSSLGVAYAAISVATALLARATGEGGFGHTRAG